MSKKLCLDDGGAVARLPLELPLELVCLILSFLFVDDIGNHNSAIGAVSRAWRDATELLAEAWNQDPLAIPMLAAPFKVIEAVALGEPLRRVPRALRGKVNRATSIGTKSHRARAICIPGIPVTPEVPPLGVEPPNLDPVAIQPGVEARNCVENRAMSNCMRVLNLRIFSNKRSG